MDEVVSRVVDPLWWPGEPRGAPAGVVVVSATYSTKELVALLLWSVYRFVRADLRGVVVVDNGSVDGSAELLEGVCDAGLCAVVRNGVNRHHGPALTQAMSAVVERFGSEPVRPWVWILDSDCVVARGDVGPEMFRVAGGGRAALLGERYWNEWVGGERVFGFSVLVDPGVVWRAGLGPMSDGGDPVGEFCWSCEEAGLVVGSFPFAGDGFVIHRGRSTLAAVVDGGESDHPLFEWAVGHHEPHFQGVPGAREQYAALVEEFRGEVPGLDVGSLVRACLSRGAVEG